MIRTTLAAVTASLVGSSATGQDLLICFTPIQQNVWTIDAEFLSSPPNQIVQIWADVSIRLTGDSPIDIFSYDPSYDTSLGPAAIAGNGSNDVSFVGNANAFFGSPNASNPLRVLSFNYSGSVSALGLELVGQNSAIFDAPPFGDVRLYMDAQGNPGELTFEICIPSPGTLGLAPIVLIAARRRRSGASL